MTHMTQEQRDKVQMAAAELMLTNSQQYRKEWESRYQLKLSHDHNDAIDDLADVLADVRGQQAEFDAMIAEEGAELDG